MKKRSRKKPVKKAEITPKDAHSFGVILEDIQSKFDTLIDGYGDTSARLERIEAKLEQLEARVDATNDMVGGLAVNLEIVKQDIEVLKSGMRTKIDAEEFSALERRVLLLESRLQAKSSD